MNRTQYDLLLVDDDSQVIDEFCQVAKANNWSYLVAKGGHQATEYLDHYQFQVVLLEQDIPDFSGFQLLEWIRTLPITPEVIVISAKGAIEMAVRSLKMGAFDYLVKPITHEERVSYCIRQAMEKYKMVHRLETLEIGEGLDEIIGKSPKMHAMFDLIRSVAQSQSNVLIQGDSGTGKELVAKAIHRLGPRKDKTFVGINCAAMPESLLESELFGYVKGAFTGAQNDKSGFFEAAHGGTLFLDEIGE